MANSNDHRSRAVATKPDLPSSTRLSLKDNDRAVSTSDVPNDEQQPPLFRIAAELRNIIYELAMQNETSILLRIEEGERLGSRFFPPEESKRVRILPAVPPLHQVCRSMRDECPTYHYYAKNTFLFTDSVLSVRFLGSLVATRGNVVRSMENVKVYMATQDIFSMPGMPTYQADSLRIRFSMTKQDNGVVEIQDLTSTTHTAQRIKVCFCEALRVIQQGKEHGSSVFEALRAFVAEYEQVGYQKAKGKGHWGAKSCLQCGNVAGVRMLNKFLLLVSTASSSLLNINIAQQQAASMADTSDGPHGTPDGESSSHTGRVMTVAATNNLHQPGFLRIPPELRLEIYELSMPRQITILVSAETSTSTAFHHKLGHNKLSSRFLPRIPAVSQVCRRTRSEYPFYDYYASNTFLFTDSMLHSSVLDRFLASRGEAVKAMSHIKDNFISITIPYKGNTFRVRLSMIRSKTGKVSVEDLFVHSPHGSEHIDLCLCGGLGWARESTQPDSSILERLRNFVAYCGSQTEMSRIQAKP
ncbi:hypothetical protein LTR15_005541 [Elasticomyces elasticus]|nr:hypothetical protein LTR15_005541 [Elasticomyces elasticus]